MKKNVRSTLEVLGRVLLFVALLALPSLARAGYYYRRLYVPPAVPRPDHSVVDVPTVQAAAFIDEDVRQDKGRVVIDRAHDNTVDDVELNVLLARLTARGMEILLLNPDDSLSDALRTADALVVISPHEPFSAQEADVVERFVEQGGRVLLAGDPSRYSFKVEYDEFGGERFITISDVAAINSLASQFGLSFSDDYIYNTTENAGNYQYIILRDFAQGPLTAGLEEVVFYASHSLAAGENALIVADQRTTSSLSEQTGGLAAMSLGGKGRVLATADFTFMTEPYNAIADNNRLIANIADFIAGAERTFRLTDFPLFFSDEVVVVPIVNRSTPIAVPADGITQLSMLKSAFEATERTVRLPTGDSEQDALYIGLFGDVEFEPKAAEILSRRGITFTLETVERERATPTPTPRYTPTPTPTPAPADGSAGQATPTPTPTPTPLRDWIHLGGLGQVEAKEVALFYQNEEGGRQVLIVLAFDREGIGGAVKRLVSGDFGDCLVDEDSKGDPKVISLALCPVAYVPTDEGLPPTPTPEEGYDVTPTPTIAEGGVLIVSDDDGEGIYDWWTSAYQFYDLALEIGYPATLWSMSVEGEVTLEQMQSYDAVVWCTGDYQDDESNPSEDELDALGEYLDAGGRAILIGAFLGDAKEREGGLLLDVQVSQSSHPVAAGFEADQVLVLERFTADEDYAPYVLQDADPGNVVFVRGPDSEFAGEAAVFVLEDELADSRLAMLGFPIYLLPYDTGNQLGSNALFWVMEGR